MDLNQNDVTLPCFSRRKLPHPSIADKMFHLQLSQQASRTQRSYSMPTRFPKCTMTQDRDWDPYIEQYIRRNYWVPCGTEACLLTKFSEGSPLKKPKQPKVVKQKWPTGKINEKGEHIYDIFYVEKSSDSDTTDDSYVSYHSSRDSWLQWVRTTYAQQEDDSSSDDTAKDLCSWANTVEPETQLPHHITPPTTTLKAKQKCKNWLAEQQPPPTPPSPSLSSGCTASPPASTGSSSIPRASTSSDSHPEASWSSSQQEYVSPRHIWHHTKSEDWNGPRRMAPSKFQL